LATGCQRFVLDLAARLSYPAVSRSDLLIAGLAGE
jgi:hypothetical protein